MFFVSISMFLLALVGLMQAQQQQQQTLVVAITYSTSSGPIVPDSANGSRVMVEMWRDFINKNGGLQLPGGPYTVEPLLVPLTASRNVTRVVQQYEDIVTGKVLASDPNSSNKKIIAIFSSTSFEVEVYTAVHKLNPNLPVFAIFTSSVPLLCTKDMPYPCTSVNTRRFKNVWTSYASVEYVMSSFVMFMRLNGIRRLALLTDLATETRVDETIMLRVLGSMIGPLGMSIVHRVTVNASNPTNEVIAFIEKARELDVDIVIALAPNNVCNEFLIGMNTTEYDPKAFYFGPRCQVRQSYVLFSNHFDYQLSGPDYTMKATQLVPMYVPTPNKNVTWRKTGLINVTSPETSTLMFVQDVTSRDPQNRWYVAWGSGPMMCSIALHAAMLQGNSADVASINAQLSAVREPSYLGMISYDPVGAIQGLSLVTQYNDMFLPFGIPEIVDPVSTASMKFVYPMPTMKKRVCAQTKQCVHGKCGDKGNCVCDLGFEGEVCQLAISTPEDMTTLTIVVAVVGSAVLIVGCTLLGLKLRRWLSMRHAPAHNTCGAIAFTDIEGSSDLWAANPEEMGHVIDVHHDIIRRELSANAGHEVKTIGDAFLIVTKEPQSLLRIALNVQRKLYELKWPSFVNEFYMNRYGTKALDGAVWGGLRVRIGIHYGELQRVDDPVTLRPDYYGHHVNLTARVEASACGGQVVVTKAFLEAVSEGPTKYLHVDSLGPAKLKGIPEPVELFQVSTSQFSSRVFTKDIAPTSDAPQHLPDEVLLSEIELKQKEVTANFEEMLAPFGQVEKAKIVNSLCGGWKIPILSDINENKKCLAFRIAKTYRGKQRKQSLTHSMNTHPLNALEDI